MNKRLIIVVALLLVLFPIINVSAETVREKHMNNSYEIVIDDSAEVFTAEELNEVKNNMRPLLEKGNVVLKTTKSSGDFNSLKTPTEEAYKNLFNDTNGIIVLINIYNGAVQDVSATKLNSMYISSVGNVVTEEKALEIVWENTPLIQEGKYKEAVNSSFKSLNTTSSDTKLAKDMVIIEDDADLLTPEEEEKLANDMAPLTEYGYIIFKSINTNDTRTDIYAKNYYYNKYGNDNGTMFLIDMANREIYICSGGNNSKIITNSKSNIITDNVYKYASNEDYYSCASNAFKDIETLLYGGKIAEPMRYASNIVISLVLGFLFTFFYVSSSMKIKNPSKKSKMDNVEKLVAISNLSVLPAGQRRVYSPVSDNDSGGFSSGGGGGGFSGGGGGGFSGSGGGHKF